MHVLAANPIAMEHARGQYEPAALLKRRFFAVRFLQPGSYKSAIRPLLSPR